MTYAELQREVKGVVKDTSANILVSIPDFVNEAVQWAAEEANIPSLKALFTVTTSTSTYYVSMPSNFSGRLSYVGDTSGQYTIVDGGLEDLIAKKLDVTLVGDIEYIAHEGNTLYYLPIPATAVTLTCIGYNVPATLTEDNDTPSDIPELLHRRLLVNKAAELAYSVIEAGETDENKINTKLFMGLAQGGLDSLRAWVVRRRSNVGTSCWRV